MRSHVPAAGAEGPPPQGPPPARRAAPARSLANGRAKWSARRLPTVEGLATTASHRTVRYVTCPLRCIRAFPCGCRRPSPNSAPAPRRCWFVRVPGRRGTAAPPPTPPSTERANNVQRGPRPRRAPPLWVKGRPVFEGGVACGGGGGGTTTRQMQTRGNALHRKA